MNCPCHKCVCYAICRIKTDLSDMLADCSLLWDYVFNKIPVPNRYQLDRIAEVNRVLKRNFEVRVGSYGYEFVRDMDTWVPLKIKESRYEQFHGGKDAK